MLRTHLLGGATALLLSPLAGLAQTGSGTISGTYNADDAAWTLAEGGDGVPRTGWTDLEDGLGVTLVGSPVPNEAGGGGTLVLEFDLQGAPQELRVSEPSVWMVAVGQDERLMAGPENIDLSVTALERDGDEIVISGNIVAGLSPGGAGELTIDNDDAVLIDGNFQATLTRLDGDD
ncbi:MAG: hypothetical protein ACOCTP_01745 [Roseicyclus sp.]